jgi:hypothetical protein
MGDERGRNQILKRKMSSKKQDLVLEFNTEQSNEMARRHPLPPVSVSHTDIGRCPVINLNLILSKESTPTKNVGTTVDKTKIPV